VILLRCDWHELRFGHIRVTSKDEKAVKQFTDLDSAFLEVVQDIKAAAPSIMDDVIHRTEHLLQVPGNQGL
jgi:hypothetical protein